MGASLGADDKKSQNFELNIVPFIDMMSVLTAFLLFTAVWTQYKQLDVQAGGKDRNTSAPKDVDDAQIFLSVLVRKDSIWIGETRGDQGSVIEGGDQWESRFKTELDKYRAKSHFIGRRDIEIATDSTEIAPVPYATLYRVMETSRVAQFDDIKLTEPANLSARPTF